MELWDFIITGTAAYGPQTPGKSDIDIVLMEEDAQDLIEALRTMAIPYVFVGGDAEADIQYPAHTFYFIIGMLQFNIIRCKSRGDFTSWRNRTEYMKKLPPIADREERLRVFNLNTTGGLP